MRIESANRAIISSGQMETTKATIKSTAKIFDMFADGVYANKPVAIARELVANGVDAHIAASTPEKPVEVTMPTVFDPEFKVKDFGIGMPHAFVMNEFMQYSNGSTKDGSDEMIGGFGIGSKSPFAYTDQYTLRVVHEGILSIYTMFKDSEGIPSIGLQTQTTTDEHNGVEVSFPVEADDMEDFQTAAQTALQYFLPLPTVINGEIHGPDYVSIGTSGKWALRPAAGDLGVIMGGVRYPVENNSLPWQFRNDAKVSPLLNYGIDLFLPIGAVGVAMSREALSYTPKTVASLTNALTAVIDEVAATFATLFDNQPSKWDAMVALYKELQTTGGGGRSGRAAMMEAHAKYKGKPLKLYFTLKDNGYYSNSKVIDLDVSQTTAWAVRESQTWRRSNAFPAAKFEPFENLKTLNPGNYEVLFVDDMPIAGKSRVAARVAEYLGANNHPRNKKSLVIRAEKNESKAQIKALLAKMGSPTKAVYLSTLPEPAKAIRMIDGGTTIRPKVRMFTFNGERDKNNSVIENLHPAWFKQGRVAEIAEADQPTKGILVVLENFQLPRDLRNKMAAGVLKYDELIFVNKSDAEKLTKVGFVMFEVAFKKKFDQIKKKYPDMGQWLGLEANPILSPLFDYIRELRKFVTLTPNKTPFGKIVKLYDENIANLTDEIRGYAKAEDKLRLPPRIDAAKLASDFKTSHPFIGKLMHHMYRDIRTKSDAELFLNNL